MVLHVAVKELRKEKSPPPQPHLSLGIYSVTRHGGGSRNDFLLENMLILGEVFISVLGRDRPRYWK